MKKYGVIGLSLFLFLGLATSVSANLKRVKFFNETGVPLTIGIEYKTRIGKWERVKSDKLQPGGRGKLKPGLLRKVDAIYWTEGAGMGLKSYRLEKKIIEGLKSKKLFIRPSGAYSSGRIKGKATPVE